MNALHVAELSQNPGMSECTLTNCRRVHECGCVCCMHLCSKSGSVARRAGTLGFTGWRGIHASQHQGHGRCECVVPCFSLYARQERVRSHAATGYAAVFQYCNRMHLE